MQCSDVQFQINALIDGELNAWSATRVRRHLKTCRDCRADYDANQRLTGQARAWRTVNAPHILGERLTDAIIHASITAENRPMPSITGTPAAPRPSQFGSL